MRKIFMVLKKSLNYESRRWGNTRMCLSYSSRELPRKRLVFVHQGDTYLAIVEKRRICSEE